MGIEVKLPNLQNHTMVRRSVAIVLVFLASATLADDAGFDDLRAAYRERRLAADVAAKEQLSVLLGKYADAVDGIRARTQAAGDLAGTIAATAEIEAARAGALAIIDEEKPLPERLVGLRRVAEEQVALIERGREEETAKLDAIYVAELGKIVPALTKAGDLERALAAREEIQRLTRTEPEPQGGPPSLEHVPEVLRDGLVVWFPFDDPGETVVAGVGEQEWSGFLTGTEFVEKGRVGGARSFDGDGDRIAFSAELPDSEKFTVAVWIKYSGVPRSGSIFSDFDGRNANDLMFSLIDARNLHIRADKSGDKLRAELELPAELGVDWHHLVWSLGSSGSKIYLDGKPVLVERTDGSNEGFHKAFLGYGNDGSSWTWYRGEMDEFLYWKRDLDEVEVGELYRWTSR